MKVSFLLLLLCLGCGPQYNPDNIDEDELIIYTKQDSIQDAYDRFILIDSLNRE